MEAYIDTGSKYNGGNVMKTYEEFRNEISFFVENSDVCRGWNCIILPKGFSMEDAIKTNLFITNSTKQWNMFAIETNVKFFHTENLVIQGDLLIVHKNQEFFSRFSIEALYNVYKENEDFTEVIIAIEQSLSISNDDVKDVAERMHDYQFIKNYLMVRPIKYDANSDKLSEALYKTFDDIALVIYAKLGDNDGMLYSATLPNDVLKEWNMSFDDLFDEAMVNTYVLSQPRLFNFNDFNSYTSKPCVTLEGAFMALNIPDNFYHYNDEKWYVLTTTSKINGSIAIFYPNVKEKLYDMIGKDYYVSFVDLNSCNIRAVMEDMSDEEYKKFIEASNPYSILDEEDTRVSKNIYKYYGKTKELKKI